MQKTYYIVRGVGDFRSKCKDTIGQIQRTERSGSAWASSVKEAVSKFKATHAGYFIKGTDSWKGRLMKKPEIESWEKQGLFPQF